MISSIREVADKALAGEPGALDFLIELVNKAHNQGEEIENLTVMFALAQGLAQKRPPYGGKRSRERDDNQHIVAQVIEFGDKLIEENSRDQWLQHGATQPYSSTIQELERRGLLRRAVELYLDELLKTPDEALNVRERGLKQDMERPKNDLMGRWKYRSEWVDSVIQIITRRLDKL